MESRFLDRATLNPDGSGRLSLHPLLLGSYDTTALYAEAVFKADVVVTYHPTVGASSPGTVHFGYSAQPVPALPGQVAALSPVSTTAAWRSATVTIPKHLLNTKKWLRITDDPGYLIWVIPTPATGYFTITTTIKSIGSLHNRLHINPDPTPYPVVTYRGTRWPSLYKVGFATYRAVSSSGPGVGESQAFTAGGLPYHMGLAQNSPSYSLGGAKFCPATNPLTPWMYNFRTTFPGHKVLVILCPTRARTNGTYGSTDPKFASWLSPTPAIDWNPIETLAEVVPGGPDNVNTGVRLGWFMLDYPYDDNSSPSFDQAQGIFADWPSPEPNACLFMYYAVPPDMVDQIYLYSDTYPYFVAPYMYANTNLLQDSQQLACPLWTGLQVGTFNPLTVRR